MKEPIRLINNSKDPNSYNYHKSKLSCGPPKWIRWKLIYGEPFQENRHSVPAVYRLFNYSKLYLNFKDSRLKKIK